MERLSGTAAAGPGGGGLRRFFSLRRANRALVLVRRIVSDIVAEYPRLLELQEMLDVSQCHGSAEYISRIQADTTISVERLQRIIGELETLGVELCDFGRGMVDFPGFVAGREVRFCWQYGQDRITHWHYCHEGPAGRKPLVELIGTPQPAVGR